MTYCVDYRVYKDAVNILHTLILGLLNGQQLNIGGKYLRLAKLDSFNSNLLIKIKFEKKNYIKRQG